MKKEMTKKCCSCRRYPRKGNKKNQFTKAHLKRLLNILKDDPRDFNHYNIVKIMLDLDINYSEAIKVYIQSNK